MLRCYCHHLFRMQYEHEGGEIAVSISKHCKLIAESISENHIIVRVVISTWQTTETNHIKSCKQLEIRKNAAMILAASISYMQYDHE